MMQPGHCWNINQMSTGYMDRFICCPLLICGEKELWKTIGLLNAMNASQDFPYS